VKLSSGLKAFFTEKENILKSIRQNAEKGTTKVIITNGRKVETLEYSLSILNPEKVLQRGYTITSLNGRILKSCYQVKKDDLISTRFSDGTVKSKVNEINVENKND